MTGTWSTLAVMKTWGYIYWIMFFNFLQIPEYQFTILGVLMIIDFIAWISKQLTVNPKNITSHKAWLGILKKIWTLISVIVIALILSWLWLWDHSKYIVSFLSLLIMAEWYSIIQHIYTIRTWEEVREYDAVSMVIRKIWQLLWDAIEKSLWKKWVNKDDDIFK